MYSYHKHFIVQKLFGRFWKVKCEHSIMKEIKYIVNREIKFIKKKFLMVFTYTKSFTLDNVKTY